MAMELAFLLSIPGAMTLALGYALWVAHRRRHRMRLIQAHACAVCRTPFSEAIVDDEGAVTRAELATMDAFQRRFAAFKIRCEECNSINICTKDGTPFKGIVVRHTL